MNKAIDVRAGVRCVVGYASVVSTLSVCALSGCGVRQDESGARTAEMEAQLSNAVQARATIRAGLPTTRSDGAAPLNAAKVLSRLPKVSIGTPRMVKQWATLTSVFFPEFSPDGRFLVLGGEDWTGKMALYETRAWREVGRIPGARGTATFSPDSKFVATEENGVSLYRVRDAVLVRSYDDKTAKVGRFGVWGPMTFSPDGTQLATFGEDPNSQWKDDDGPNTEAKYAREIAVKLWDVATGQRVQVVPGIWNRGDSSVAFVASRSTPQAVLRVLNGSYEIAARTQPLLALKQSFQGGLQIVPIESGREIIQRRASASSPREGTGIFVGGKALLSLTRPEQCNAHIAPDASLIVGSSALSAKFWAWRARDGKLLSTWTLSGSRANTITLSPDARFCVVAQPLYRSKTFPDGSTQETGRSLISVFDLGLRRGA